MNKHSAVAEMGDRLAQ